MVVLVIQRLLMAIQQSVKALHYGECGTRKDSTANNKNKNKSHFLYQRLAQIGNAPLLP
jgi:hypothetical protein